MQPAGLHRRFLRILWVDLKYYGHAPVGFRAAEISIATHVHPVLATPRLRLRPWRDDDLERLSALNADPRVMEHFPALLTRAESEAMLARLRAHFDRQGFGMWAIEVPGVSDWIGFCGLAVPTFEAHFTPCVEIGWRLLPEFWGHGYATEAARAGLAYGFDTVRLGEIVAITSVANQRSRRVMERVGMNYSSTDDFDHPKVPQSHPLSRCVLYRLSRPAWEATSR